MSLTTLLVVLLLVLVVAAFLAATGYVAVRHPRLASPITTMAAVATPLITLLVLVLTYSQ